MSRWFTSDWHLGHARILEFCHRPFNDVQAMNASLVEQANRLVGPDDELWLLGDIAMGNLDESLAALKSLRAGHVVLVAGNHDRVHPVAAKSRDKATQWAWRFHKDGGVDEIIVGQTSLSVAGETVVLSHFPYAGSDPRPDWEDRFGKWRPRDEGRWLLCGHVHGAWQQSGRIVNVGVDAWGGRLVSEDDVARVFAAGPADRPAVPWPAASV